MGGERGGAGGSGRTEVHVVEGTQAGVDREVGAGEGGGGGAGGGLRVQEYRGVGWGPLVVGTTIVCCGQWTQAH